MILVEYEDGSIIGPIKSWRTVKNEKLIKSLILTDNHNFIRRLTGFDYYYADCEAIGRASSGESGVLKLRVPVFTKETIYGIRDISLAKNELLTLYNVRLKDLYQADAKQFKERAEKLKNKYENLHKKLLKKEVESFSLVIESGIGSLKSFIADPNYMKDGILNKKNSVELLGKNYVKYFKA